jgi:hypothetical protein
MNQTENPRQIFRRNRTSIVTRDIQIIAPGEVPGRRDVILNHAVTNPGEMLMIKYSRREFGGLVPAAIASRALKRNVCLSASCSQQW